MSGGSAGRAAVLHLPLPGSDPPPGRGLLWQGLLLSLWVVKMSEISTDVQEGKFMCAIYAKDENLPSPPFLIDVN